MRPRSTAKEQPASASTSPKRLRMSTTSSIARRRPGRPTHAERERDHERPDAADVEEPGLPVTRVAVIAPALEGAVVLPLDQRPKRGDNGHSEQPGADVELQALQPAVPLEVHAKRLDPDDQAPDADDHRPERRVPFAGIALVAEALEGAVRLPLVDYPQRRDHDGPDCPGGRADLQPTHVVFGSGAVKRWKVSLIVLVMTTHLVP